MPKHPWRMLLVDFYGPLQTKEYLLMVIDRYSQFPEVDIVHSTKASAVIPKFDKMFEVHSIPDILIADNSPPFNSTDYKRYLDTLGITPKFSTPLWPQGNAQAEYFMKCQNYCKWQKFKTDRGGRSSSDSYCNTEQHPTAVLVCYPPSYCSTEAFEEHCQYFVRIAS